MCESTTTTTTTPRDPPSFLHRETQPPPYITGPTPLPTTRDPPSFLHRGTHPPSYNAGPTLLHTARPTPLPTSRDPPPFLQRGTHPPSYTAGLTPLPTPRDPPPSLHRGTQPPPYGGTPPLHRGAHLTKTTILRPFLDSSTRFTFLYVYPRRFHVTPTPPRTAPYPRSPPFIHTSTSALLGRSSMFACCYKAYLVLYTFNMPTFCQ